MISPSSPSVQVTSVTRAPSAAYLAIVAPVPIDSSSGCACTSSRLRPIASAASGYVCPLDDAAESFVVGVVVAPDDVAADHAGLLVVTGMVGPVEREVAQ